MECTDGLKGEPGAGRPVRFDLRIQIMHFTLTSKFFIVIPLT